MKHTETLIFTGTDILPVPFIKAYRTLTGATLQHAKVEVYDKLRDNGEYVYRGRTFGMELHEWNAVFNQYGVTVELASSVAVADEVLAIKEIIFKLVLKGEYDLSGDLTKVIKKYDTNTLGENV